MIDLRSDTVTQPTHAMRFTMCHADVGDDVIDVDPTCERLQKRIAEMLGKEAALFVPSGTMANQIALRLHCRSGDEFLCEAGCHIFKYEQGGYAQLSGLAARPIEGKFGVLRLEQLRGAISADNEHFCRTKLVCLENTHNRGGGRILPFDETQAICEWAQENGLKRHLDGARLFNAAVASGIAARDWASLFDTVSVCFSKGLGAPVGSAICGPKDLIAEARRHRKLFGGGMRQVGILASAALFALEKHVDRLAVDHDHAKQLADTIRDCDGLRLTPDEVDTNIVIFEVDPKLGTAAEFVARLTERGVKMLPFGPQSVRAVTHLDVGQRGIATACEALRAMTLVAT